MHKLRGVKFLPIHAVYDELESSVDILIIIAPTNGLHSVLWTNELKKIEPFKTSKNEVIVETKKQLNEYLQRK